MSIEEDVVYPWKIDVVVKLVCTRQTMHPFTVQELMNTGVPECNNDLSSSSSHSLDRHGDHDLIAQESKGRNMSLAGIDIRRLRD